MAPFHPVGQNPTLALERDLDLIVAPGPARLRRGVGRRAPLGRLRDHRVARGVHRRRRGAHQAHQARHRRELAPVPPPADARRPHGAARSPHARPHDARRRPGPAHLRRAHARHPGRPAAPAHGGGARRDHGAAPRRDRHVRDRVVHRPRRAAAAAAVQRPVLRHRGRGVVLPDGRARRGQARHRHALGRGDREAGHGPARATTGTSGRSSRSRHGHVADRSKWRLVGPMHLAETREQAERDVEYGIAAVLAVLHPRAPRRSGRRATPPRRSSRTTRRPASR